MAVLTQVRVGTQRYGLARMEYDMSEQSAKVDERTAQLHALGRQDQCRGRARADSQRGACAVDRVSKPCVVFTGAGRVGPGLQLDRPRRAAEATLDNTTVCRACRSRSKAPCPNGSASPSSRLRRGPMHRLKSSWSAQAARQTRSTRRPTRALQRNGIVGNTSTPSAWTLEMAWSQTPQRAATVSARST